MSTLVSPAPAQPPAKYTEGNKDQVLRGNGRVNPSTLGMELDISLGNYPGRGIDVPVTISYSSKVWRLNFLNSEPLNSGSSCYSLYQALYSDRSASGWTTSLATPYIEYVGWDNPFDQHGFPLMDAECLPDGTNQGNTNSIIKRIIVHLPSGETHELRSDDSIHVYNAGSPQPTKNGIYFATDSSNIKYVEDSVGGTYKMLMPDGSFYEFAQGLSPLGATGQGPAVRKAQKFQDRNGNTNTFNLQNGAWTDTLQRNLKAPFGLTAPGLPTDEENPQIYSLPGMTGTFKFHWKRLKGETPQESGLTDFDQALKYLGDRYLVNGQISYRPPGEVLFSSENEAKVMGGETIFNPVVLTRIDLPTGGSYRFSYDVYGRMERIYYPTGGEERFTYGEIPGLSPVQPGDVSAKANFGVITREMYEKAGQGTPYPWEYEARFVEPRGYKVIIKNPEDITVERFIHRGNDPQEGQVNGSFGFDDGLAGMVYEERTFDKTGVLVSKALIHWEKNSFAVNPDFTADWHPRVTHEERFVYDPETGDGVGATTKFEYEGNLDLRETPVLTSKTSQFQFEPQPGGGNGLILGENPDPNPTPVPTPVPQNLLRTLESTYLINDPEVENWKKDIYKNRNLIDLVSVSEIKNPVGEAVSRSETIFDEGQLSPEVGRGNPTSEKVWDSGKGVVDDPLAFVRTRAKFDEYGNLIEQIDANGKITRTEFDPAFHAYPVRVTTPIPGDGMNSADAAFETVTTYEMSSGLPLSITDLNGRETTFEYDWETLRLKRLVPPAGGSIVEKTYNDQANEFWVKSRTQIDQNKWIESTAYFDGLGRPFKTEKIDEKGNIIVEKEFDSSGRVSRMSNPYRVGEAKNWTTNVYDDAGRLREAISPDGAKIRKKTGVLISDLVGTTAEITDQAGKKRTGVYDALGRILRVVEDPEGQNLKTDYLFDQLGNLRKTVQGEQVRYFWVDSLNRLLYSKQPEQEPNPEFSETDPLTGNAQWSAKYEYDEKGNMIRTTDARGVSVEAVYDNLDRIISRDYSDSTPDVSFFYDGTGLDSVPENSKGKITRISNSVSETRNTGFDNLGRIKSLEQSTGGRIFRTSYVYNLGGDITEATYPSGRKIFNAYDQNGDLVQVSGIKANQSEERIYLNQISYNPGGEIEKMRLGNGRWETAEFNQRQQVTKIGLGYSDTDSGLLKIEYGYGDENQNNGSLLQQKIKIPGLSNEIIQDYAYDSLNRLESARETTASQISWQQSFDYDRYGNRSFDQTGTSTLGSSEPKKVTNPSINSSKNRLVADQDGNGQVDYQYDKNGNVILNAENQRFSFDGENRLIGFFGSGNQTATPNATYEYDGRGKRVRKVQNGVETIFAYDIAGNLIAEYSTETSPNPKTSYLTNDHLGSPRIITDGAGAVISRHDYLPFGNDVTGELGNVGGRTESQGYNQPDDIRKKFTGYERDEESGLDFAQARYYQPGHGRFTSVDPLMASANVKNPQTLNRYSYVLNNPYKFVDPLGLISENTGACGTNCVNSGSFLDGSSYSGVDDSVRDAFKNMEAQRQKDQCQCKAKKKPRKKKRRSKKQTPKKAEEPQTNNGTGAEEEELVQINTTTGNSEELAREIAKSLNETYIKEQAIIEGLIAEIGAAGVKALASELGETFDPQISGGTDTSVKIDLPSPGTVLAEMFNVGVDSVNALIQNRIQGENNVNLILMNADVNMQGRVDEQEIRPTLEQARARGIELHKNAVKRLKP
ncbi:MAG: RHS repeat-associated core domain-containing protein [Pyrinomonadaceae bacterium]